MPTLAYPRHQDGSLLIGERNLTPGQTSLKRTDNGSEQLNVDGRAAGTADVIWNGTGAGDTGGDWAPSGVGSEQAAADAGSGTNMSMKPNSLIHIVG